MKLVLIAFIAVLVASSFVYAQPTPATTTAAPAVAPDTDATKGPKEVVNDAKGIYQMFKDGKFREATAGIITLLLFLWRRFASKFVIGKIKDSWWLTFIAVLIGFLTTIPLALTATGFSWWTFLWEGLAVSAEAIAFWSILGKKVLPKVFGEVKPIASNPA